MIVLRKIQLAYLAAFAAPLVAHAQPADAPRALPDGAPAAAAPAAEGMDGAYVIGPGDELRVFVWKNPDLSTDIPVRPDGKITTPLAQDIQAQGRTPTQLAAALHDALAKYIQDPVVTVLVKSVAAPDNSAAIRVIGAAQAPKTIPYRSGLTVLDVVIQVGGLNAFANGNAAELIRKENGIYKSYGLHLNDLISSGDLKDNVKLMPGDIVRIPERWF